MTLQHKTSIVISVLIITVFIISISLPLNSNANVRETNNNYSATSSKCQTTRQEQDTSETFVKETHIKYYTDKDAIDIAKVLYNECRGVQSKTEQACVAWTILNRVDKYSSTVYSIVRAPNQFVFSESTPVWSELLDLSYDVLRRWNNEKNGETNVGRVLPQEYIYFEGHDGHNFFRNNFNGSYDIWDYSIMSPYKS